MAVELPRSLAAIDVRGLARRCGNLLRRLLEKLETWFPFTTLTRRIIFLNLFGLTLLVTGILYLNQFRAGLIDAKVQSLLTQGEIIAGAIAASAAIDTDRFSVDAERYLELEPGQSFIGVDDGLASLEFPINPERAAPILRRLIKPTGTRARIYNRDGALILDSDTIYSRGEILRYELPPPDATEERSIFDFWHRFSTWLWHPDLPLYKEIGGENGRAYPEVTSALTGTAVPIVRVNDKGEMVVSVAVPVQRMRAVLGVLLLSTRGGDIDGIVSAERWAIIRVALFAAVVVLLLSLLLARTVAGPIQRLAHAAESVRRSITVRAQIPDYTHRPDEIGHLSGALRDMTSALYRRIDAIESFAADVTHELKNPLTSLRSAAETLPLAKDQESYQRLLNIIDHDVKRLDRLISDISDASRLDAELARGNAEPVNVAKLLKTVIPIFSDIHQDYTQKLELRIAEPRSQSNGYDVMGHDSRLGQVVTNLLDNAISFSPSDGRVTVIARRVENEVEITIEDEGPGIAPENLTKIFDRFYTDRPEKEEFGKNSGLGLNISRQIILAHGGRIWAENCRDVTAKRGKNQAPDRPVSSGARFVIRLPAASS